MRFMEMTQTNFGLFTLKRHIIETKAHVSLKGEATVHMQA